jgi:hypothetical protein
MSDHPFHQEAIVLSHRSISRVAILGLVACALLGATFTGTAAAVDRVAAAKAQGRYYASFRNAEPIPQPSSASDGTSWVLVVGGVAIVLIIVAGMATQGRRSSVRRRAARVTTSA